MVFWLAERLLRWPQMALFLMKPTTRIFHAVQPPLQPSNKTTCSFSESSAGPNQPLCLFAACTKPVRQGRQGACGASKRVSLLSIEFSNHRRPAKCSVSSIFNLPYRSSSTAQAVVHRGRSSVVLHWPRMPLSRLFLSL
jgi:hypothetical protein